MRCLLVCCLLIDVCCLRFVRRWLLFVVYCPLFIGCSLFVRGLFFCCVYFCCTLFVVCCLLFALSCVVCCLWFVVCCFLFVICRLSFVRRCSSFVVYSVLFDVVCGLMLVV